MKKAEPSLHIVVAITSVAAFLNLDKKPIIVRTMQQVKLFTDSLSQAVEVSIALAPELEDELDACLKGTSFQFLKIFCNPNDSVELMHAIAELARKVELVLVHDSNRPLTNPAQFLRVLNAIDERVDAVRPLDKFTETIKVINSNSEIVSTIDRSKVMHVKSPEVYKTSKIDIDGEIFGWFLPLRIGSQLASVEADPVSLRINSEEERDLVESLLHWQQTTSL